MFTYKVLVKRDVILGKIIDGYRKNDVNKIEKASYCWNMHNILFAICVIIAPLRQKLQLDLQADVSGFEFVPKQNIKLTNKQGLRLYRYMCVFSLN